MNGEEMNSASMLMNLPPAAPAAAVASAGPAVAGVEPAAVAAGGFDQALAAAQAQSGTGEVVPDIEPASLELASGLLVRAVVPAGEDDIDTDVDADTATDAAQAGAAAVLAQMLAGSAPSARPETQSAVDAATQSLASQFAPAVAGGANPRAKVTQVASMSVGDESTADAGVPAEGSDPTAEVLKANAADSLPSMTVALPESPAELPASGTQQSQSAPQSGNSAQAAVQAAASALRDATPAAAAAASVPAQATLRESVGTARWADELGNRLVLMSVRGQQHGSLTLTPEHLGPVEVQISMNRDTANVWFGAQHADTRTALAEAMPRLRELLAASGISLGQSGVSEQAPRENMAPQPSLSSSGSIGGDAGAVVENAAPAWRIWRPGLIDTYA
jgi:flagellar hook-length control protein FliK